MANEYHPAVIISRDGSLAIETSAPNGNFPVAGRDAFAITVALRAIPGGKLGKVGGIFDNLIDISLVAHKLSLPTESDMGLSLLEAAIGESLDVGREAFVAQATQGVAVIECNDDLIVRWADRPPATDREVENYFKRKLYHARQYNQRQVIFSTADTIRLHVPQSTLSRVAELGYKRLWDMAATPGLVVLIANNEVLLEQRELLDPAPDSPSRSVLALLGAPRYKAPRLHWEKALAFYGADQPDLANAAKEAVTAVEALAVMLTGSTANTLGKAIAWLRSNGKLNPTLADSLEKVWGFACNSPGVRHGSAQPVAITAEEANFVRQVSDAAIRLLLPIDT